jgi:hypothetical protein
VIPTWTHLSTDPDDNSPLLVTGKALRQTLATVHAMIRTTQLRRVAKPARTVESGASESEMKAASARGSELSVIQSKKHIEEPPVAGIANFESIFLSF